jgi:20S proteasome subunit alpha 6
VGARGGRGVLMSGNRGGLSGGRGRGSFVGGSSRAGSGGGPSNGSVRGHGSRNNFGGGSNRRGGGSFNSSGGAGYSHQGGSSFRGRNQGNMSSNRGNRPDGGSGSTFGSREGTMSSNFGGKKDENRRTLTDFKIVGLAIPDLSWTWGVFPSLSPVKADDIAINVDGQGGSRGAVVKEEVSDNGSSVHAVASSSIAKETQTEGKAEVPAVQSTEIKMADAKPLQDTMSNARVSSETASPPSRIRIYFHTPVTADDSRPIPHNSAYGDIPSDSRKGKRKKLEDDDGDLEERRAPPPPPQMGGTINDDQLSATASVAETASEGDWLMAAIVEGEDEGGGATGDLPSEDDEDSDQLHVSEIKDHEDGDSIDDNVTIGDTETFVDGEHCHNASRYYPMV